MVTKIIISLQSKLQILHQNTKDSNIIHISLQSIQIKIWHDQINSKWKLPENLTLFDLGKIVPLETELCEDMSDDATTKSSSKEEPKFKDSITKMNKNKKHITHQKTKMTSNIITFDYYN